MLKKEIKKSLLEIKEKKEIRIIEEKIVKNRISIILEDVRTKDDFKKLSKQKQLKMSVSFVNEVSYLQKNGLLSEQNFTSSLSSLFGGSLNSLGQTIVEPIVGGILSKLGFGDGFFKNFLVSALTTNIPELIKAFGDCKVMTKLLVKSFIEAEVMVLQKESGLEGKALDFVRNGLGQLADNVEIIRNLENSLSGTVCGVLDKYNINTQSAVNKLKDTASSAKTAIQGIMA
jgi:hypothetical protein